MEAGHWTSVHVGLMANSPSPLGMRLKFALGLLFGNRKSELHHRPALVNRRRYVRNNKTFYDPTANSADHLVYLLAEDHDIETRVRGLRGQHCDLGLARKRKRAERKKTRPKRTWASRPFRGVSRWPQGRKIRNRRKPSEYAPLATNPNPLRIPQHH